MRVQMVCLLSLTIVLWVLLYVRHDVSAVFFSGWSFGFDAMPFLCFFVWHHHWVGGAYCRFVQFFLTGFAFLSVATAMVLAAVFDLSVTFFPTVVDFGLLACCLGAGDGALSFFTLVF